MGRGSWPPAAPPPHQCCLPCPEPGRRGCGWAEAGRGMAALGLTATTLEALPVGGESPLPTQHKPNPALLGQLVPLRRGQQRSGVCSLS